MSHLSLALLSFQVLQLEKVFVSERTEELRSEHGESLHDNQRWTEPSYNDQFKNCLLLNTSVLRSITRRNSCKSLKVRINNRILEA